MVIFTEDFENVPDPSDAIFLNTYTGAAPLNMTYTADGSWISGIGCNGLIISFNGGAGSTGCSTSVMNTFVRPIAQALGNQFGGGNDNQVMSDVTTGSDAPYPATPAATFETASDIPLPSSDRYLAFSIDVGVTTCSAPDDPLLRFFLVDGTEETSVNVDPINPCTAAGGTDVPGGSGGIRVGTFATDGSILFPGSQVGVKLTNDQVGGSGNDYAVDNIRLLDATPQLDKDFSSDTGTLGEAVTLTFTITNTSELAAKLGWSFTDALPDGLVVADSANATTDCTDGTVDATPGGNTISVAGDLETGQTSCQVTVDVTSDTLGTYENCDTDITAVVGLNLPACDSVTFAQALPVVDCTTDPSVFNTASDGAGGSLSAGALDLNWDSGVGTPDGGPASVSDWIDAFVVAQPAPWFDPPIANADWISHWADTDHSAVGDVDVYLRYQFELDAAVDPASFALGIDYYADNSVWAIYINGVAQTVPGVPQSPGDSYQHVGFTDGAQASTFLDEGWQTGLNELVVQVRSGVPLMGFLAQVTAQSLCPEPDMDFGDAPDTYGTLLPGGARHSVPGYDDTTDTAPLMLGATIDVESDGQPTAAADGDDVDGFDDEDGVAIFPTLTTSTTTYSVDVSCTGAGTIAGWIDFDRNDAFDGDERTDALCDSGTVTLTWDGLSGLVEGVTYARFRIASDSAEVAEPIGVASDGEVEDYSLVCLAGSSPELPDVFVDCPLSGAPLPSDFAIEQAWESEGRTTVAYQTPLVGDLFGNGQPVIVVGGNRNLTTGSPSGDRRAQDIHIYNGNDGSLIDTIVTPYFSWSGHTAIALADVNGDGQGEILFKVTGLNPGQPADINGIPVQGRLIAYTYNNGSGDWEVLWVSDQRYDYGVSRGGNTISVADFNGDGVPEVYVGTQIFNASTGVRLATATSTASGGCRAACYYAQPAAVDMDGDGQLELVAGNVVYDVVITSTSGELGNSITVSQTANAAVSGVADGPTAVADIDLDGTPDVIVSGAGGAFYVWNGQTNEVMGIVTGLGTLIGAPLVGDIDGDGEPEMVFVTPNVLRAYDFVSGTGLVLKWSLATNDGSGTTSLAMFDFNNDGIQELVYRDEALLRIMDGSADAAVNHASFACTSGTDSDMPVIADIDGSREARIVVTCGAGGSNVLGNLRAYQSGTDTPWANTRPVWNQQNYFVAHINNDLSVPANQFEHWTAFNDPQQLCGGGTNRPLNAFQQQVTDLDTETGCPVVCVPPIDFGDAPEPYGTLRADEGARHLIVDGLFLGSQIDFEPDGLPNAAADGDDTTETDDEDGVAAPISGTTGQPVTVTVSATNNTGGPATLAGWIDLDGDQVFEPEELISVPVGAGMQDYSLDFPALATSDNTYARFRLFPGDVTDPLPIDLAPGGEVEDYLVTVGGPILLPFDCTTTAYLSQNGSALANPADLYTVNVVTGESAEVAPNFYPTNVNAIGYNPLDNYIYGWVNQQYAGAPEPGIARIGADYTVEYLGLPTNWSDFLPTVDNTWHIGDFDENGHLWMSDTRAWVEIDLDSTSGDFMEVIDAGLITIPVAGYTYADWGYNPQDGLFYTIAHTGQSDNKRLWSFDPATGVLSNVVNLGNIAGSFGAIYTDAGGNLFGSNNSNGQIWLVPLPGGPAQFLAQGPLSGLNDGALCFLVEQPLPGLEVTKVADAEAQMGIVDGQVIEYTITVTNTGNETLFDVEVTDALPNIVGPDCGGGTNIIATLAPDQVVVCTATYTVTQLDIDNGGTITNTVMVEGCTDDDPPACTTDEEEEEVPTPDPTPGLEIDKEADDAAKAAIAVGQIITYTFTVQNTGNVTLSDVLVSDPLVPTITCDGGNNPILTLAPNATETCQGTYEVTQQDFNNGEVVNTATVEGCFTQDNCTEDEDNETVPAPDPEPDLDIDKEADAAAQESIGVGQVIDYTFTVENTGNVTLFDILVSDPLVPVITCDGGNNPITALDPGEVETCTGAYTVVQADVDNGEVVNTASATGCFTPDNCVTDEEEEVVPGPDPDPELNIDKEADATAQAGIVLDQTITYTLTVTNIGNVTLTDIVVTDDTLDLETGPDCGDGTNVIADLEPDDSVQCIATYIVTQADVNNLEIVNTASAEGCFTPDNCVTDEEENVVPGPDPNPDLDVDKEADAVARNEGIEAGQTITYTISVRNIGNVTLTDIEVTDPLVDPSVIDCGNGTNVIPSLDPDVTVECTAPYVVTQTDINNGGVTNTATASGCFDVDNCVTEEGEEFVEGPDPDPALEIDKVADGAAQQAIVTGQTVTYTFTVENTGNVTLTDILVSDPLVPSITCEGGSNPIASLDPNETEECTGTYLVTQQDFNNGEVVNTASVEGCFTQDNCTEDEDEETVPGGEQEPDLEIVKEADEDAQESIAVGQTIEYTFTVTNTGNVTLTDIQVQDVMPSLSPIVCEGGLNPIASLEPNETVVCTATYQVTQADVDEGRVENTATASGCFGNDCVIDEDEEVVPARQAAGLSIEKRADAVAQAGIQAGQTIEYTFTVTNTGNVTLTDVVVEDGLPGVTPVECGGGTNVIASLAPNQTVVCSASYVVTQADAGNGQIVNTASVTGCHNPCVTEEDTETVPAPPTPTPTPAGDSDGTGTGVAPTPTRTPTPTATQPTITIQTVTPSPGQGLGSLTPPNVGDGGLKSGRPAGSGALLWLVFTVFACAFFAARRRLRSQ